MNGCSLLAPTHELSLMYVCVRGAQLRHYRLSNLHAHDIQVSHPPFAYHIVTKTNQPTLVLLWLPSSFMYLVGLRACEALATEVRSKCMQQNIHRQLLRLHPGRWETMNKQVCVLRRTRRAPSASMRHCGMPKRWVQQHINRTRNKLLALVPNPLPPSRAPNQTTPRQPGLLPRMV